MNVRSHILALAAGLGLGGGIALSASTASAQPAAPAAATAGWTLKPFFITFEFSWKGMNAGVASLSLRQSPDHTWLYESRSHARGIFKLALSGEILQKSTLRVGPDGVQPLHFFGDDGSSKTDKDVDLRFDWQALRATGKAENRPIDVALEPGVQDGMSVQVALMQELAKGNTPTSFRLLDKNQVKDYEYARQRTETLDTVVGKLQTVVYRSRRPDSRYSTWYWVAPELGYLPVKVERRKVDDVQWSMLVQSVKRD